MFFYEGFVCPVCGKPLRDSEDIVACPDCGAPHHRACWQQEGRCHFAADHGTDRQWTRDNAGSSAAAAASAEGSARACPHCGHHNPVYAEFCGRCGQPLEPPPWQSAPTPPPRANYSEYSPFYATVDPYGGVSPDEMIDGVPASELAAFVNTNTPYYLPRFKRMQGGSRISWNWAAFLLTPYWLLYRKQYLSGLLVLVFEVIRSMVEGFILYGVMQVERVSVAVAAQTMLSSGSAPLYLALLTLTGVFELAVRVFFGLSANGLYLRGAVSRIGRLKAADPSVTLPDLAMAGGVSFGLGIIGYTVLLVAGMIAQYAFLF
ncbi:MAG: RING finger protein [Acutalibacteraceae bacterium]|jgi:hypothetical protein